MNHGCRFTNKKNEKQKCELDDDDKNGFEMKQNNLNASILIRYQIY